MKFVLSMLVIGSVCINIALYKQDEKIKDISKAVAYNNVNVKVNGGLINNMLKMKGLEAKLNEDNKVVIQKAEAKSKK